MHTWVNCLTCVMGHPYHDIWVMVPLGHIQLMTSVAMVTRGKGIPTP